MRSRGNSGAGPPPSMPKNDSPLRNLTGAQLIILSDHRVYMDDDSHMLCGKPALYVGWLNSFSLGYATAFPS